MVDMWGNVVALVRRWRQRARGRGRGRRSTARVVDESALDLGAHGDAAVAPTLGGALARALLALACFDGEEEAWAASVWRQRADEVSHLMLRESMRYAIYA